MKTPSTRISIGPLVIVLLFAAIAVNTAAPLHLEAAPIPIAPGSSISDRVRAQRDLCEIGGGSLGTATTYSSVFKNVVTSVSTVCSGGTSDGMTCTNTQSATDCKQIRVAPTESVVPEQRPDTAEQVENPEETSPIIGEIVALPGEVAEDPTAGDGVAEMQTIADQATVACEALGGTATVNAQHPTTTATFDVQCIGGMLDGMICYGTICDYFAAAPAGPGEDARVPPTDGVAEDPTGTTPGEIAFVEVASMAELEDALLAENPDAGETVVIYNQSGPTMSDNATDFVLACEAVGGTVRVTEDRTVGSGLKSIFVRCTGGLLGGLGCGYLPSGYSACFFKTVLPEDAQVTPAAGVEDPAGNVPTETVVATEAAPAPTATATPPMPTMAPTEVPVEPTVAPPSDPPPPKNDSSAPPSGPVEDPAGSEPTPTPVVLT